MAGALTLATAAIWPCDSVHAHLGHVVMRAERYLKIEADDRGVRVVVTLTLGPAEAQPVLRAADEDDDGTLTAQEADTYMAQWGEGLRTDLPIEVDGSAVEVTWGEPYLDPLGSVRPTPTTVEMVAHVPLDGGAHRVTVRDRMRTGAFDRTDVVFRVRDGSRQVACGVGEQPTSIVPELAFGPEGDAIAGGALTTVVEIPGAPRIPPPVVLYVAIGAAALLGLVGLMAARRRARRDRPGASHDRPPPG